MTHTSIPLFTFQANRQTMQWINTQDGRRMEGQMWSTVGTDARCKRRITQIKGIINNMYLERLKKKNMNGMKGMSSNLLFTSKCKTTNFMISLILKVFFVVFFGGWKKLPNRFFSKSRQWQLSYLSIQYESGGWRKWQTASLAIAQRLHFLSCLFNPLKCKNKKLFFSGNYVLNYFLAMSGLNKQQHTGALQRIFTPLGHSILYSCMDRIRDVSSLQFRITLSPRKTQFSWALFVCFFFSLFVLYFYNYYYYIF